MRRDHKIHDHNILELVRGLLLSEISFQEIFKRYKKGHLHFSDIASWVDDKGQSPLYNLKEQCHSIFRNKEKGGLHNKEGLLDLVIGSIFHEAMKFRENIYQLDIYRPKYLQYKLNAGRTPYERNYLQQFERIIAKAEQGVLLGMAEIRSLFHDAMEQLTDFFRENSKNPYLARFLLDHQSLLKKVYGRRRAKEILNTMFENGIQGAYLLAGRGYLDSEHYDLSSLCFSKALKLGPSSEELLFLMDFSRGMDAYYKNAYSKALSLWGDLIHLRLNRDLKKNYVRKMEEVCRKIKGELREERRLAVAKKAGTLADQIRKML